MTGNELLVFVWETSIRGFPKGGRGCAQLVLPDADPQQRRDLERVGCYRFDLDLEGEELYSSPPLRLGSVQRHKDGALVMTDCL
ncbi:hypothetical protein [Streptomyces sp. NPDC012825]|uniref:hypothetical protein n=1 Tax=Streptomyces sp. NPDC012825 TaxID=3364851 RepID=UPI0036BDD1CD